MSKIDTIEMSAKLKEAALIIVRAKQGKLTVNDKKILNEYCAHGANDTYDTWFNAALKYQNHLKASRNQELAILLDNGMLFDFQKNQSAAPNELLRGKLFAPIARGRRKLLNRYPLGGSDDGLLTFEYSGAQLDQADLDTLLTTLRVLSDSSKTGNVNKITDENGRHEYTRIRFSRYGFLKELKRQTGRNDYRWLDDSLRRLTGELSIHIKDRGSINGPIIGKRMVDDETGDMVVDINQDFTTLFKDDQFAFVDMDERLSLPSGFAKWLHGFVLTHSGESYLTAEQLMDKSGSTTKRVRDFMRQSATPAFKKLEEMGVIKNLEIRGQLYKWRRWYKPMDDENKYIVVCGLYGSDEQALQAQEEQYPIDESLEFESKLSMAYQAMDEFQMKSIEWRVNQKIREGYKPIGGVQIATDMVWKYHQAMLKLD